MLKDRNASLYQYREQYERRSRLSDRLITRASNALAHCEDDFKSVISAFKVIAFGLPAIAADRVETSKRRKRLRNILRCPLADIAVDVNELAQKRESVKYYGDDFTYSSATPKKWLKNIQVIFGDAHLEALDEMTCLGSLDSVWGSVYVSRCTDLSGLNLTVIKGDFHGEKLETASGLERLAFVGGKIFYQDRQFSSLEEFQRFCGI